MYGSTRLQIRQSRKGGTKPAGQSLGWLFSAATEQARRNLSSQHGRPMRALEVIDPQRFPRNPMKSARKRDYR